jgi:putative flippase GtrA
MKRQEALFVALCLGTVAFAIGFVYPQIAEQAVLQYYPLEHRWSFEARPQGLAMDFYGRLGQAMVAWAIGVIASLAVVRRIKKPLYERAAGLLIAWALTFTVLVIMYYAWTLFFRHPTPAPIPDWYRPR